MKRLYVIAGCDGAGKTTASYTVLPEILNCNEFVNADEIAKGLSPFQPENVSIEAGKLMLTRINTLLEAEEHFAFETTLSTRSYTSLLKRAQQRGYKVILLFFWLHSPELAISRVAHRVKEGGHAIPEDVIRRRYERGLSNLYNLYLPVVDTWMLIDNSGDPYEVVAEGAYDSTLITNVPIWEKLKTTYYED